MEIKIARNTRTPVYWQIANEIKKMIIGGTLPNGSILPSERSLAGDIGVHRNTVVKAYSLLRDQDLLASRQGDGYYVTYRATKKIEKDMRLKVNWSHIIKDKYQDMERTFDDIFQRFGDESILSLSTGMVPAVYDEENIASTLAEILQSESSKTCFLSPYQGDVNLRQQIVYFLRSKGIKAQTSEIQIMNETNQALDYIVTTLLEEGDKVIIEEPVSPDVYRVIELADCIPITVPVDDDGMICDSLEALIETHNPKFIYVNSSYHDPTGAILSLERRKKLIELSNKYRLPIIEEDAASEICFEDVKLPTIKSMDRSENVIYIYSFSLTFIPGISLAFLLAPSKLAKILGYMVSIRMMTLDWMTQKLLAKYMEDGTFQRRLQEIVALVKEKRDIMCGYLDEVKDIGLKYKKPRGGVYVWCRLPEGVDCKTVVSEALKNGISVFPGDVFYPDKNGGQNYIRLNYSYETKERLNLAMVNFIRILRELAH